jgi:glycosyltransferase involved in cell wall biosynthesis
MRPKVSVVTAVRDNAAGLRQCLGSVFRQEYPAVESIVIDGGSRDGTVAVLEAAAERITHWVSEPDRGIADAMNKGLAAASGELVVFLHSDDRFADPHALGRCVAYVEDLSSIWACEVDLETSRGCRRVKPRPLNWWAHFRNPIPHQGVLCPRAVFERLGGFDVSLRIDMDYDLWLRADRHGVSVRRVPQVLSVMGGGGVSSRRDWAGLDARFREERLVQERHAPRPAWRLLYGAFWPLYRAYRRGRLGWGG